MDRIHEGSDEYIVKVKAQVMVRDDNKGGWLPIPNAMSVVGIQRRPLPSTDYANLNNAECNHDYIIYGLRTADNTEVINCRLKRELEYTHNKSNPTFVHWKTEGRRIGLTFLSYSDARAFDKGLRRAMGDLLGKSSTEEDVFMPVELPIGRGDSSSNASTATSSPPFNSPVISTVNSAQDIMDLQQKYVEHPHLQRVVYVSQPKSKSSSGSSDRSDKSSKNSVKSDSSNRSSIWTKKETVKNSVKSQNKGTPDTQSVDPKRPLNREYYVHFKKTGKHDYNYPNVSPKNVRYTDLPTLKAGLHRVPQVFQHQGSDPPPLPKKKTKGDKTNGSKEEYLLAGQRLKCKYCNQWYSGEDNPRGSCPDTPDTTQDVIDKVTCMPLGNFFMYHCAADSEGNYNHPCICESNRNTNCKKWTVFTILSFFIPCLWCYWPLTACHQGCLSSGCCRGRHSPS